MRRTVLLVLALPTFLLGVGLVDGVGETGETGASPLTADARAPVDTSDGAGPAVPPGPSLGPGSAPGTVTGSTAVGQDDATTSAPALRSPEGFLIASGGTVTGSGPRWRYTVEVEPATGLDLGAVVLDVTRSLGDTRSWSSTRTLERIDDPSAARIRLVVATPDTVDRLCGAVGLQTAGIYSCWTGRFAALNAWRWDEGAEGFDDILTYRHYLVNHEFGHGLGYGHLGCPSEGSTAPVMMQQSKGLDGCTANGWPYP